MGLDITFIPIPITKLSITLSLLKVSINIPEIFLSEISISFGHLYFTLFVILNFKKDLLEY